MDLVTVSPTAGSRAGTPDAPVRFTVLGPVRATRDGRPLALPGRRARSLVARLLVAGTRVVPADRLVDDLWAGNAPAPVTLQALVSHLRRELEPGRPPRSTATLLVTRAPGYALVPDPGDVDAWRLENSVREAGASLRRGDVHEALASAERGLSLWAGQPLAEFASEPWALGESARLEELHLVLRERWAEAEVLLGHARDAVPQLQALVAEHPLREEAQRLLALSLYASGRHADALAGLGRARRALRDELGLDPGPALRRLEVDILGHAPSLPVSRTATGRPDASHHRRIPRPRRSTPGPLRHHRTCLEGVRARSGGDPAPGRP